MLLSYLMAYDVAIGLLCRDFIFSRSIVSQKSLLIFLQGTVRTYKTRCGRLCICVCFKFPGVCFCQELAKLDDIWQSYQICKNGDFFSETVYKRIGLIRGQKEQCSQHCATSLATITVLCQACHNAWVTANGFCCVTDDKEFFFCSCSRSTIRCSRRSTALATNPPPLTAAEWVRANVMSNATAAAAAAAACEPRTEPWEERAMRRAWLMGCQPASEWTKTSSMSRPGHQLLTDSAACAVV